MDKMLSIRYLTCGSNKLNSVPEVIFPINGNILRLEEPGITKPWDVAIRNVSSFITTFSMFSINNGNYNLHRHAPWSVTPYPHVQSRAIEEWTHNLLPDDFVFPVLQYRFFEYHSFFSHLKINMFNYEYEDLKFFRILWE